MDLNTFLVEIQPVLTGYARRRWNNLYTPVEDLVQETLIYIWKNWEDRIKDHEKRNVHCCKALDYIAQNTYLKEHKEGLWAREIVSDYVSDHQQTYRIECLCDPWLEQYYEKRRAYGRERYKRDRERMLENSKRYYREHREELSAKRKAYYEKNKETVRAHQREYRREYQKEYYRKNRERIIEKSKEYYKKYYQENREKALEYRREYYRKNKERILNYPQNKEYHRERSRKRYEMLTLLRDDVEREFGIHVNVRIASRLLSAKNRSESEFLDMIEKLKAGDRVC